MAPRAKATKTPETASLWQSVLRQGRAQIRFLIALAFGLAVALLAPIQDTVPRILAGWNAGGWLYLLLVGIKMWQAEVEGIKREAGIERESRIVVLVVVIFGSIFTMLALFAQLMALKSEHGIDRTLSIGFSIATIFLSWLLIHTVFALYYAHEFHSEGRSGSRGQGGGLKFPDDHTPDYLDFLYFSFVVGTTAQTSDVAVCSRAMRRVVMLHGILSFFFNTAVIALAVNIAAQLVQG
jgi:uncharacterized membrane protein